jgi:hypothetical protein
VRILVWHVHGSWLTAFVQGPDEYLVPVLPDRGPDGRGRARTWDWPAGVREVTPEALADEAIDVVVLQRPEELALVERWTGRRPGPDVPAVFVEHNTPYGTQGARRHPAVETRHPLAGRGDVPVVHVTHFNAVAWDCGSAPTTVIEHGVVDPGPRYTGERARVAAVVNEPVRRGRVAGTDLLLRFAERAPVEVYGMGMAELAAHASPLAGLEGHLHDDVPQDAMHTRLAQARAYLHPYRWTSLGLSLVEAMALGMPVLALATTAAAESVPGQAGVVSNDLDQLVATARRWLHDPDEARERGAAARRHALTRFGLDRFLADWQVLLKEVTR